MTVVIFAHYHTFKLQLSAFTPSTGSEKKNTVARSGFLLFLDNLGREYRLKVKRLSQIVFILIMHVSQNRTIMR